MRGIKQRSMVSYMEKGKASGIGPVLLKLFRIFPPSFSTSRHSFIEKRTNQSLSCFDLLPPTFCSGRKILRNSCSKHFWQQLSGASDCVAWRHQSQQVGWKARALLFVPESQKITFNCLLRQTTTRNGENPTKHCISSEKTGRPLYTLS